MQAVALFSYSTSCPTRVRSLEGDGKKSLGWKGRLLVFLCESCGGREVGGSRDVVGLEPVALCIKLIEAAITIEVIWPEE